MACQACGAANAANALACGACGHALGARGPQRNLLAGTLALRVSAVLTAAAGAWLLLLASWLVEEALGTWFSAFFAPLVAALVGVPAVGLLVLAWGTWRRRTWGVMLTLGCCALVAAAGLLIAAEEAGFGLLLLAGATAVGGPLLLPDARAAHR